MINLDDWFTTFSIDIDMLLALLDHGFELKCEGKVIRGPFNQSLYRNNKLLLTVIIFAIMFQTHVKNVHMKAGSGTEKAKCPHCPKTMMKKNINQHVRQVSN